MFHLISVILLRFTQALLFFVFNLLLLVFFHVFNLISYVFERTELFSLQLFFFNLCTLISYAFTLLLRVYYFSLYHCYCLMFSPNHWYFLTFSTSIAAITLNVLVF